LDCDDDGYVEGSIDHQMYNDCDNDDFVDNNGDDELKHVDFNDEDYLYNGDMSSIILIVVIIIYR
jgi:hypothetical protein